MENYMRYKRFLFALLGSMSFLIGCHNNPIGSGGSVWTQATGVSNVNHFYASGGNLLASTYCNFCSEAYIFISRDEGATWKLDTTFHVYNHTDNGYITSPLYLPAPLTFINDGSYLLAGVGYVYKGDIYRSTDNGLTWSDRGVSWSANDSDREDVYCFCVLNGDIFAGTDDGIFVSTDHGSTWNSANVGIPKIPIGTHLPVSGLGVLGDYIFATTWSSGIFRSTNDGASWTQVNASTFTFQGLATVGSDVFAAAFNDEGKPWTGGVFVSTDNGVTWQHADVDLPDHGVGVICTNSSYLFAGTETGIFYSSDLGITWNNISVGSPIEGDGATALYINDTYLFANSAGGVWRYPLFILPGFTQNTKNEISKKPKGG